MIIYSGIFIAQFGPAFKHARFLQTRYRSGPATGQNRKRRKLGIRNQTIGGQAINE